jgi:hypothetical protein
MSKIWINDGASEDDSEIKKSRGYPEKLKKESRGLDEEGSGRPETGTLLDPSRS